MTHDEIEQWSPLKSWLYSLVNGDPKSNAEIIRIAGIGPDDRFLDVGCGPGAALARAAHAGADVAGVDPSPAMVARAARRVPGARVAVGSAEAVPFQDNAFTVAINVSSFHHWADREAGLREMRRVLEPGGRLHIVEGKIREGKDGHGLNSHQTSAVVAKLGELGYVNTTVESFKTGWRHEYVVVSGVNPV